MLLLVLLSLLALLSAPLRVVAAEPPHCVGCMNGMPMDGCPIPQQCGYLPILCVGCSSGKSVLCPNPDWCAGIDCTNAHCKDGEPTASCPDPGTCNFEPIPCIGCVPGLSRNGCPRPELCANNMTTYPCIDCMDMYMPLCPNATMCTLPGPMPPPFTPVDPGSLQCIDCMAGMAMPQCPYPELCLGNDDYCPMAMYFGVSADTCVLFHEWHVTRGAQWAGVFFAVLLLAFLREALSVWRVHRAFCHRCEETLRRMYLRDPAAAAKIGVQVPGATREGGSGSVAMASPGGEEARVNNNSSPSASTAPYQAISMSASSPSSSSLSSSSPRPLSGPRSNLVLQLSDSVYYTLSLALGYLLMLLIMTYNVGLCVMVVLCCGFCHFVCNYAYHTAVRHKQARRVQTLIAQFQAVAKFSGSANGEPLLSGGALSEGRRAPVTGGDHCCDDINFDDI